MSDGLIDFWRGIDHVLLDMDGTLLDKHFDDYFWETYVPEVFAKKHRITKAAARDQLLVKYKSREGSLEWTDLDFWSRQLGLDIPALKVQVEHLIDVHPHVVSFLEFCRAQRKDIFLVTNAHTKSLDLKMNKTAIGGFFDRIVCSQEVGAAKEEPIFWKRLGKIINYDPHRSLLADDTEAVLHSARSSGIRELVHLARANSRVPAKASDSFKSINYFKELIPDADETSEMVEGDGWGVKGKKRKF